MDTKQLLIERLETARRWTNGLLEDIETGTWFDAPGQGLGHCAWQIGHLAASQIVLLHMRCFGRQFADCAPAEYQGLFARGSTPVADAKAYPPLATIRDFFDHTQKDCLEMIRSMPESELDKPTEPHPMFSTKAGAISMLNMHECFHAGQIALIRRLRGKAPLR
ncbi:MAG TPA: DinB family protein [Phycisphaerae bacterium]|nr:DinB family protein [Phycisphaerae bacterium]